MRPTIQYLTSISLGDVILAEKKEIDLNGAFANTIALNALPVLTLVWLDMGVVSRMGKTDKVIPTDLSYMLEGSNVKTADVFIKSTDLSSRTATRSVDMVNFAAYTPFLSISSTVLSLIDLMKANEADVSDALTGTNSGKVTLATIMAELRYGPTASAVDQIYTQIVGGDLGKILDALQAL